MGGRVCNPAHRPGVAFIWNDCLSHARSATLLRAMVRHKLGGDHDDGTYAVP